MKHTKLLDCTLRDGAYLIDKKFGDNTIRGIISGLVKARIDFIEIGFLQDEGFGEGKTVFRNSADAKRFIPDNKNGCKFTALADYSRFSVKKLDECTGESIDAIRECFFKQERFQAIKACMDIRKKGYKLFIQPVDILGYTDLELLELLHIVNEVEPYCFSIVDTFGSMYQEDLHRIFELIHHNLSPNCRIGFHSHNNMQLSNALSQEFIRMTVGQRTVVVDGTLNGMGRGAGNTPTELIAQYLTAKLGYPYDMDALLDVIDGYMDHIRSLCTWGYTTPFFVAGCFSAHINNVVYLSKKNSIRSKDIRLILNKIGASKRKRYDYSLLENAYMELMRSDVDDSNSLSALKEEIKDRPVLILAPGSTISTQSERIQKSIFLYRPVIISINFISDTILSDYIYISNVKRYNYWKDDPKFLNHKKILTSNITKDENISSVKLVSFTKLIKCGWESLDNSTIMLLRLLDIIGVSKILIAGFDGYEYPEHEKSNYVEMYLELQSTFFDPVKMNDEISEMFLDYLRSRKNQNCEIQFITSSRFQSALMAE